MNLIRTFKELCKEKKIEFLYGGRHWQNLMDLAETNLDEKNKRYLMLSPISRKALISEQGIIERYTLDCIFFFCIRSSLSDPSYDFKYEHHLSPLYNEVQTLVEFFNDCTGFRLEEFRHMEIENYLDTNLDGLKVNLTLGCSSEMN